MAEDIASLSKRLKTLEDEFYTLQNYIDNVQPGTLNMIRESVKNVDKKIIALEKTMAKK